MAERDDEKKGKRRPNTETLLVQIAADLFVLRRRADKLSSSGEIVSEGDVYVTPKANPAIRRDLADIRDDIGAVYLAEYGSVPSRPALANAMSALRAKARKEVTPDKEDAGHVAGDLVSGAGVEMKLDSEHPERPEVRSANRNPFDVAREVADHLLKQNDPPRLFRMGSEGTAVVQVLDDGTLLSLDQNQGGGWLTYVAERITFVGGGDAPRIIAPPAPVMKMMPTLILPDLPVLDGLAGSPYLDSSGEVITRDGYHPGSRLYLLTQGLELPPISAKPTREEVRAARELLLGEWLRDFPFVSDADRANAVAELLTITGRPFVRLAPLFVNDASTPGSGKGLLTETVYLIATGKVPEFMELPLDADEQRKTITASVMKGDSLLAWDESPVIAGRSLSMILTAEVYSARVLGTAKMVAVRNRFTQIAIGNNVDVRGDLKRRVLPCRLAPDVDHPEHRTDFRHPDLKRWVRENRAALLHAALTIWRHWDAAGRKEAAITIGSFEHWARTVGGALSAAGIHGFATNIAQWLSYAEEDDGWNAHLIQLRSRFADRWFTVGDVADAVQAGYLKRPPVKRGDEKDLALQVAYAYRGLRERWYGPLRLIRSETRDGATGSHTWSVRKRDEEREKDMHTPADPSSADSSSVSSGSSAGKGKNAGQATDGPSPDHEADGGADQASSGAEGHPQDGITAGQRPSADHTEDAEHGNRQPGTARALFTSACPDCGEAEDSVFHAMTCLGQDPAA